MAVNDIYKVLFKSRQGVEPYVNVFHYKQIASGGSLNPATEMAAVFQTGILTWLAPLLPDTVAFDEVEVINMRLPSDFAVDSTLSPATGSVVGNALNNQVVFSYRLNRLTPGTRAGFKRFGNVPVTHSSGNSWIAPNIARDALRTQIVLQLTLSGETFAPFVARRDANYHYGVNPSGYIPVVAQYSTILSSQDSRRIDAIY